MSKDYDFTFIKKRHQNLGANPNQQIPPGLIIQPNQFGQSLPVSNISPHQQFTQVNPINNVMAPPQANQFQPQNNYPFPPPVLPSNALNQINGQQQNSFGNFVQNNLVQNPSNNERISAQQTNQLVQNHYQNQVKFTRAAEYGIQNNPLTDNKHTIQNEENSNKLFQQQIPQSKQLPSNVNTNQENNAKIENKMPNLTFAQQNNQPIIPQQVKQFQNNLPIFPQQEKQLMFNQLVISQQEKQFQNNQPIIPPQEKQSQYNQPIISQQEKPSQFNQPTNPQRQYPFQSNQITNPQREIPLQTTIPQQEKPLQNNQPIIAQQEKQPQNNCPSIPQQEKQQQNTGIKTNPVQKETEAKSNCEPLVEIKKEKKRSLLMFPYQHCNHGYDHLTKNLCSQKFFKLSCGHEVCLESIIAYLETKLNQADREQFSNQNFKLKFKILCPFVTPPLQNDGEEGQYDYEYESEVERCQNSLSVQDVEQLKAADIFNDISFMSFD